MQLQDFLQRLDQWNHDPCLVNGGTEHSFEQLDRRRRNWLSRLPGIGVAPGSAVGLKADYSIESLSLLLALFSHRCVVAFIPFSNPDDLAYIEDGQLQGLFRLASGGAWGWEATTAECGHPLLRELRRTGDPGFIVFSSGSSGKPKAILHDLKRFLGKYEKPGKRFRTLAFLLFDHIAGVDTMFYTLINGGALVIPENRDPHSICRLIEETRVEVLPTSPTFLNLLSLSGDASNFDLSSLQIITYGSEPMSQATLERLGSDFPQAKIVQKYGTSEFGSPRALSRGNDSLWIQLKPDETEARIEDGVLWVRSSSSMLGYLNAPSPFDQEGWYCTGDLVEVEGDWIRIVGRRSDVINVGGEKVIPSEVEGVILELPFVEEVLVKGESNVLVGQIVTATVGLNDGLDQRTARKEIRARCRESLEAFKVPARIEFSTSPLVNSRQKKNRRDLD